MLNSPPNIWGIPNINYNPNIKNVDIFKIYPTMLGDYKYIPPPKKNIGGYKNIVIGGYKKQQLILPKYNITLNSGDKLMRGEKDIKKYKTS